jgi:hypothetical protein
MTKSFYAIGMFVLTTFNVSAQNAEPAIVAKSLLLSNPFFSLRDEVKVKAFSTPAEDRFRKDYGNVNDAEWVETPEGYRVYFTKDEVITAVDYRFNGKVFSVIRYGKNLLGDKLAAMVNKRFDVTVIKEVSEVRISGYNTSVYIVVLEDKTSVKTLQIMENEIKVLQEQRKV